MKFAFAILAGTLFLFSTNAAQSPLIFETAASRNAREQSTRAERDQSRRMDDMRNLEFRARSLSRNSQARPVERPPLDQKTRARIRDRQKVDAEDIQRFKDVLRSDKTGIFRLFPDFDCDTSVVIRIDGACTGFVPESSDFSFRTKSYAFPDYHDIGFEGEEIVSNAFFSQGILVSLGDLPVEKVSLSDAGLAYLVNFMPARTPEAARQTFAQIRAGVRSSDFSYSDHLPVTENTTYALRSIAYKLANSLPAASSRSTMTELRLLSLDYDERADVIVVFRVIRRDPTGNITILWRELSRGTAPSLKFNKGADIYDFKR